MPHPAPEPLTPEQYLERSTIPLVPASLTDPCNICQTAYQAPLVLSCGHVFCRACIEPWFTGSANTCPTCRAKLFVARAGRAASSSRVEHDGQDMTDVFGSFALAPRPAYAGALVWVGPAREILHCGVVVARDGALTWYGACGIVRDLWCRTAVELRARLEFGRAFGPGEAWDVDVEVLRSCIQRVIPGGVWFGE